MKLKRLLVFFLFWSFSLIAQEKKPLAYNKQPLNEVLFDLEKQFNVKFSFDSQIIKDLSFTYNEQTSSLKAIISEIEIQTDLEFSKASKRYYIITKEKASDYSTYQDLQEVFVTEYLTKGIKKKNDGSIVLTPKKLEILPGLTEPDILQSLQSLPGINSPNETATDLYVRGGTPDQNLVLWDGIKIYNTSHFFGAISAFNPYIIENVNLFSSGTKAKYGNRVSSVIDISSENTIPERLHGGLGLNLTHANLYLKVPIGKKLAVVASTRRSFKDVLETFTFKNLSDKIFQSTKISDGNTLLENDPITITNDAFVFSDITAKIIYKPSKKDEIVLSSLFASNNLDYGFRNEEFQLISKDQLDVENNGISFKWNHHYNTSFSQSLQGYNSKYNLRYFGGNEYLTIEDFDDTFTKENTIDDLGVSLHNNWKIDAESSINFGYEFSLNKVSYAFDYFDETFDDFGNAFFDTSDALQNRNHSLYGELNYSEKEKWSLNAGFRLNYSTLLDRFYVEPRLYYEKHLNPHFKLKFSLEQLNQTVSQIEELVSIGFGLESDIWVLADEVVASQLRSNQFSTGANYKKNGWTFDIDFYAKKIKGVSSFKSGFNQAFFGSKGVSDIIGLDLSIKKKMNNYSTWLSYSYLKNDYTFSEINEGEAFPANFHIANQFVWSHAYQWNNFNFSLGFNYRTGIPYTQGLGIDQENNFIIYDTFNAKRLPNYHRLDFASTYSFKFSKKGNWKGKIGLSIFNIYDKKNVLSRSYRQVFNQDQEAELREVERRSLRFTPNILFKVYF